MNAILLMVIVVVIFLLVFVLFSLDDTDDEPDFLDEEINTEEKKVETKPPSSHNTEKTEADSQPVSPQKSKAEPKTEQKPEPKPRKTAELTATTRKQKVATQPLLPTTGSEEDLKIRLMLDQRIPLPTSIETTKLVAMVVQLRCPEELYSDKNLFFKAIYEAEKLLEEDFSFDFSAFQLTQLNRALLFFYNEEKKDPLFEALIVAFEIVTKFKKVLETNKILNESKIKVSVGLSSGEMFKLHRGIVTEPTWVGAACLIAETLAESAADFSIYVDERVYIASLPLIDFREWKPIKLRPSVPPIPIFELVGWNRPDEIASYIKHENEDTRCSVAIAYRYLDLDDRLHPLFDLLTDTSEKVALEALETLRVIASDQSIGILKRVFLETEDPLFRSRILDVLASIGNTAVVPLVLGSTKEANWRVRLSAARALFKLLKNDSLKHLEELLKDQDTAIQAAINAMFFAQTKNKEYYIELTSFLTDLSQRARKIAIDELIACASDEALTAIVQTFSEQDFELKKYILSKFEYIKSKILYQCYLKLFQSSDEKIRPLIVESLKRAGLVS